MNSELLHLEDLDRFAGGQMSAQEIQDFRQRLATDKALMAEFELYQILKSGIKTFHRQRLLGKMAEFEASFQQNAIPFYHKTLFRRLSIAASVTIALGAGILMWNKQHLSKDNWQASFIDDPGLPVLMSSNKNAYNQAMNFYRQGAYRDALNTLPANTTDTTSFYRGIFWLKLQNPDSAYRYLSPLRQQATSAFREKAEYYSAMALWQHGKTPEAEAAFKSMAANTEHPFHDVAVEILKNSF